MSFFDRVRKSFLKEEDNLKIGSFGIMNNPEYRQEPWKESIKSRLYFFDIVCIVCGNASDIEMIKREFPNDIVSGKLVAIYKHWPFPEWSYEELPKHLNESLSLVKKAGCDWAVKLDIDTVFHEKDKIKFRATIRKANNLNKWVVSFLKLQFFIPTKYWVKGYLPIAINLKKPIVYGFDVNKYTDLCQPIEYTNNHFIYNDNKYDIPVGNSIEAKKIISSKKIKLFNYDFTFRTYERAVELLYQIEMAHARFWGKGYSGFKIESITRESSMKDFLDLSLDRCKKMKKTMDIMDHPVFFRKTLESLKENQWGFSLWNKL